MLRAAARDAGRAAETAIPPASAEAIASCDELRYSTDTEPGITRRRAGAGFFYLAPNGRRVSDRATLERIRKLATPPAYRNVWICRDAQGHLQVTGIDARGRKQYRYHAQWRSVRDTHKFERMFAFGRALPRIHRRVAREMKLPGMPREKVLATVVRLLESTLIRVGNIEYARANGSYGLTTLRNRHAEVKGVVVQFSFRGKHGVQHQIEVADPRSAEVVRRCLDLPGQELFQYVDENGVVRDVGSSDVNQYLQEIAGEAFTAKDFRTWYATSAALEYLAGAHFRTARDARNKLKEALEEVAARLRNTPTMCRKCYVNPLVIDAFLAGELRRSTVGGGSSGRVRLLQLLARTPAGVAFKAAPQKRGSKRRGRPARKQSSLRKR